MLKYSPNSFLFFSLISRLRYLFSATPVRRTPESPSFSATVIHRAAVHCGRRCMQLTNRNCGHISWERAQLTLWAHSHTQTHADTHTHKHAHTPIQFAALWQAFSTALRDSKSITNAACPVVGWPNSSALLKISPFGRCPASHAKAHVALTVHLLIHTYTHLHVPGHIQAAACHLPRRKVQKGMWQRAYHSPINCSRYLHENTRCVSLSQLTYVH